MHTPDVRAYVTRDNTARIGGRGRGGVSCLSDAGIRGGKVAEGYQFAVITALLMNNGEGGHMRAREVYPRGGGRPARDPGPGNEPDVSDDDRAGSRRPPRDPQPRVGGLRQVDISSAMRDSFVTLEDSPLYCNNT